MSLQDKCIITAALSGAATMKSQNPAVPYSVDEFVEEAYRCYNAGCSIVHIHARDHETGLPTASIETLSAIVRGITEKCPIVINLSTAIGIGATPEERINVVQQIKPEMASLNTNSMNFALGDWKNHTIIGEIVFTNTFEMLLNYAKTMKDAGTKPELEVYDLGGLYNTLFIRPQGILVEPLHYQFVWGVLEVAGSISPTSSASGTSSPRMPPGAHAVSARRSSGALSWPQSKAGTSGSAWRTT